MNVQWPIGPMPAAQWHAEFQTKNGRAATDAEYQAAAQIGHISDAQPVPAQPAPSVPAAEQTAPAQSAATQPAAQSTEGLAQAAAGAQQIAVGAAQFAQGATKNAQNIITKRMAENKLGTIAHLSALGAALLTIIASFMPALTASVSGFGVSASRSINWYERDLDGPFILILGLAILGLGIAYLFVEKSWARYTFAGVSLVTGLIVLFDTINVIGKAGEFAAGYAKVSAGFGVYLMLMMSLVLIAAAVLVSLNDIKQLIAKVQSNSSQNAAAQPAQQYQQAPQGYQAAPQQAPMQQAPAAPAQPEQPGQQPSA
ncbi:MAG: hypothetical protein Q4P78_02385 [Rothia sp. (in: high G+C Gram-positive bacteria)]|uniref:hypothetical protein n=1 Tax=Rothia sp. (in: high G+C Gram-positive bacteria) TaxID=1885016 RepID=UPI0026DF7B3D|nr:hypothetical protein [Rothia sp. (in: high G+C Gram-positive bacteria)]MDO5750035.1 hypothetical protein [Rothia sp. (in: high G+C Gram-positive bacteria)]